MLGSLTAPVLAAALVYGYARYRNVGGQNAVAFAVAPGVAVYYAEQLAAMEWLKPLFDAFGGLLDPAPIASGVAALVVGLGMSVGLQGIPAAVAAQPMQAAMLLGVGAAAAIVAKKVAASMADAPVAATA